MVQRSQGKSTKTLVRWVAGLCMSAGLVCTTAAQEMATDVGSLTDRIEELEKTTQEQRQLIDKLVRSGGGNDEALQAYREASFKRMIDEAMATASEQNGGLGSAFVGYDKGLHIRGRDGKFESRINGAIRMRYISNSADRGAGLDESNNGLQVRYASLGISGFAYSPQLTYGLSGKYESGKSYFKLGSAFVAYQFDDHWQVRTGAFNPVFMRESVTELQGVDQSLVREVFKVDITDAVQLQYANRNHRFAFAIHDGSDNPLSNIDSDNTEFAVLGRAEMAFEKGEASPFNPAEWFRAMAGDSSLGGPNWGQWATPQGWSKSKPGVIVGAAVNYEHGERGGGANYKDALKYTFDIGAKAPGWNVFLAFAGEHRDTPAGSTFLAGDRMAVVAQGGYFIKPDKVEVFARYEYLDLDGVWSDTTAAVDSTISLYTVGVNWFIKKHATKFSLDLVYTPDSITADVDEYGLLSSTGDQFIVRAQLQFKF